MYHFFNCQSRLFFMRKMQCHFLSLTGVICYKYIHLYSLIMFPFNMLIAELFYSVLVISCMPFSRLVFSPLINKYLLNWMLTRDNLFTLDYSKNQTNDECAETYPEVMFFLNQSCTVHLCEVKIRRVFLF